jgi:diadenosine tetraphosphatase ApaH/serine/threonine PP2A family protein phosphatase
VAFSGIARRNPIATKVLMPGGMLKRLLTRRPRVTIDTAHVPDGLRVYAVGDIHGRVDLLRSLHRRILADARSAQPGTRLLAVYLGDYIDRGLHSREVIELLLDEPLPGFECVHVRGNHDQELVAFLDDPVKSAGWLRYGGDATLYSYGVRLAADTPAEERLTALRDLLQAALPPRHMAFLEGLPLTFEVGDYLFVHAGIDPDKALDDQIPQDLLWIRDRFLEADGDFGKVVVHGHSITELPDVRENRIGVDTGACFTNALTCVVLEGNSQRFLSTREPCAISG